MNMTWSKQWIKCQQDYRLFSSLVFQCWVWLHSHPPEGHQVCTAAACLLIHAASCLQYKRPSHAAAGFYMFNPPRVWQFVRRFFIITAFLLVFSSWSLCAQVAALPACAAVVGLYNNNNFLLRELTATLKAFQDKCSTWKLVHQKPVVFDLLTH